MKVNRLQARLARYGPIVHWELYEETTGEVVSAGWAVGFGRACAHAERAWFRFLSQS